MNFLTIMLIVLVLVFVVNMACNGWFKLDINVGNEEEPVHEDTADEESRLSLLESENARLRQENADLAVKINRQEYR